MIKPNISPPPTLTPYQQEQAVTLMVILGHGQQYNYPVPIEQRTSQEPRVHLAEMESKIADLTALRAELKQLINQCHMALFAE